MEEFSKLEAEVATLTAQLQSLAAFSGTNADEPFDRTQEMIAVAYAAFNVLVQAGLGSGNELAWSSFLKEALQEVIGEAEKTFIN